MISERRTDELKHMSKDELITLLLEAERALGIISGIGGNLPDEAIGKVNGINDGRARAINVVYARQTARAALKGIHGNAE